jgi:hypothetical protein
MNAAAFLLICINAMGSMQIVADYPIHNAEACANVLRLYTETHHANEHRACFCARFKFAEGDDDLHPQRTNLLDLPEGGDHD